jgi:hypothetical protein
MRNGDFIETDKMILLKKFYIFVEIIYVKELT